MNCFPQTGYQRPGGPLIARLGIFFSIDGKLLVNASRLLRLKGLHP